MSPNGDCFFTSLSLALELLGSDAPHDISQIPVRHRAQYLRNLAAAKMRELQTDDSQLSVSGGEDGLPCVFTVQSGDITRVECRGNDTEDIDVAVMACVLQVGVSPGDVTLVPDLLFGLV